MADILFVLFAAGVVYVLFFRGRKKVASTDQIAWLAGPGTYLFDIVGESKYQRTLEGICGGRTDDGAEQYVRATLYLEDSNPYDDHAVRVDIEGVTVGYLSRANARDYRIKIANLGHPRIVGECNAVIVGGWSRAGGDVGHFGVRLDLPVA